LFIRLFFGLTIIVSQTTYKKQYLVVFSLDGFRWDYQNIAPTPNLDFIQQNGVKAERMKPSFPTKTFPNHYTLVTGLYPDNHGIVNNTFSDSASNQIFMVSDRSKVSDAYFYNGEPIWNTAIKQGKKAHILYWIGSEAPIQNMRPTEWYTYNHSMPFEQRIDKAAYWLALPDSTRPDLIMCYFDQPDTDGHNFGPNSPEIKTQIMKLDSLIGLFLLKIKQLPHYNQINFIVTSDHGMSSISQEKTVYINELINGLYELSLGGNPIWSIKPKQGKLAEIQEILRANPNISTWHKSEIPKRLHYGSNARISDIVITANPGWSIELKRNPLGYGKGTHGYDNDFADMHTIFYAIGPAFKKKYTQPLFNNVDLYSIMCGVLNLNPAKNDGSLENVRLMFAN